jgi:transposase
MYFDDGYTVTEISRKPHYSPTTIYRYIKIVDFNEKPKKANRSELKITPYLPDLRQWLDEDKSRHRKQRHTAKRAHERLQEIYPEYDISYNCLNLHFQKLRKEVFQTKSRYLSLTHIPGEAQVDFGMVSFYEKGILYNGYILVLVFPHSNASFCQLYKSKNAECMLQGLKDIFNFLGGVPHTNWFDNDAAIVSINRDETIVRSIHDLFLRFKNHYDFQEVFCSPKCPNEKGVVENAVSFLRKKLFVPIPKFDDLEEFNRQLLDKCTSYFSRKNYKAKIPISELYKDDIAALAPLPEIPFDVATIRRRKVDCLGKIVVDGKYSYFAGPDYAYKPIQIRQTYNKFELIDVHGKEIVKYDRLHGFAGQEQIRWEDYLPVIINKPSSIRNLSLNKLFSKPLKSYILSLITADKKEFLKGIYAVSKESDFTTAISIAEVAAEQKIICCTDFIRLWNNQLKS